MRAAVLALASLSLLGSCGNGASPGQGCTLVGCADQFVVTIQAANGAPPPGAYTLSVTADGATTTCSFTLSGSATIPSCPAPLSVSVTQPFSCDTSTDGGVSSAVCRPIPGRLDQTVALMGTPSAVHVVETIDGAPAQTLVDQSFAPDYREVRPNGPACGPVCRSASAAVTIARP
jgi:hypothetical protein